MPGPTGPVLRGRRSGSSTTASTGFGREDDPGHPWRGLVRAGSCAAWGRQAHPPRTIGEGRIVGPPGQALPDSSPSGLRRSGRPRREGHGLANRTVANMERWRCRTPHKSSRDWSGSCAGCARRTAAPGTASRHLRPCGATSSKRPTRCSTPSTGRTGTASPRNWETSSCRSCSRPRSPGAKACSTWRTSFGTSTRNWFDAIRTSSPKSPCRRRETSSSGGSS